MAEIVLPGSPFPVFFDSNNQTPAALNGATITASGSAIVSGYGTSEVILFVTVAGIVTGVAPTLFFTLAEVDPNDNTTVIGSSTTSSTITASNFRQTNSIPYTFSGVFKVSWTVGGTMPSFAGVTVSVSGKQTSTKLVDAQGVSIAPSKTLLVQNVPKVVKSSSIAITFHSTAPATADTLLTLVKSKEGVSAAGATSITASSGTVMRLTGMFFSLRSNAAAAAFSTITFRWNPTGATILSSGILLRTDLGNTAATIGAADTGASPILFPDGMDFTGTQSLGLSLASQAVTNILSITLFGYEYFA